MYGASIALVGVFVVAARVCAVEATELLDGTPFVVVVIDALRDRSGSRKQQRCAGEGHQRAAWKAPHQMKDLSRDLPDAAHLHRVPDRRNDPASEP